MAHDWTEVSVLHAAAGNEVIAQGLTALDWLRASVVMKASREATGIEIAFQERVIEWRIGCSSHRPPPGHGVRAGEAGSS